MSAPIPQDSEFGYFFQDEKNPNDKEKLKAVENRIVDKRPPDLPKDYQILADVITQRVSNIVACKKDCVIPIEAHEHVPHFWGAIKAFGGDNISKGINKGFNLMNRLEGFVKTFDKSKSEIIMQVIKWGVAGFVASITAGLLYYKLKGG